MEVEAHHGFQSIGRQHNYGHPQHQPAGLYKLTRNFGSWAAIAELRLVLGVFSVLRFPVHFFMTIFLRKEENHSETYSNGDDEWWEYFPCPFCYIEVEVPSLCDHLQEEHCFDMKNAVCPICADNLGTDTAEHFREQHSHLLKMRKSSSSKPSPAAAAAEKKTYEEDSYFEPPSHCMGRSAPDFSPDPLLSWFICSAAPPVDSKPGEAEEVGHASPSLDDQRLNQVVVMNDASRRDLEERLRRVEFVKQIVMTTISED